jgi:hypothetical protein
MTAYEGPKRVHRHTMPHLGSPGQALPRRAAGWGSANHHAIGRRHVGVVQLPTPGHRGVLRDRRGQANQLDICWQGCLHVDVTDSVVAVLECCAQLAGCGRRGYDGIVVRRNQLVGALGGRFRRSEQQLVIRRQGEVSAVSSAHEFLVARGSLMFAEPVERHAEQAAGRSISPVPR